MKAHALEKPPEVANPFLKILSSAVEQTADHVMITDREGCILYVNPAFELTTGYQREEVLGGNPNILKSGHHDKQYYENMWKTILGGKVFRSTMINKKKNGELYYADQTITPFRNEMGEITHFVSVWKDITERIKFEKKLEKLTERLTFEKYKLEQILNFDEKVSAINRQEELIDFVIQKSCDILESQRCSLMLLDERSGRLCIKGAVGLSNEMIKESKLQLGEGIAGLVAKEGAPMLVEVIDEDKRVSRENRPGYKTKSFLSVPIKLGQKLIGVVNVTDKLSKDQNVYTGLDLKILMSIVREAAVAIENAQIYRELKYLTIKDPMTNLFNFRYFTRSLDLEIKRMKRFSKNLCLLMIDVDDFKAYNDDFGHLEGDRLLKYLGKVFTQQIREIDILCRYAGDEFVIILPETDISQARVVAQKILMGSENFELKRKITLSIGVAQCANHMDRHDIILKADQALYEAKKNGKNRFYAYK